MGFTTRVPLLNNRFLWWDFAKVMVISAVGMWVAVLAVSFLVDPGDPVFLPWQLPAACVGVIAVCWVIACLVLGNAYSATIAIDDFGVRWESGRKEKAVNTAVFIAGALAGSPGAAGAGLLAESEQTGSIPWAKIRRLNIHAGPRVVSVRNSWRVVVRLYVPAELWDEVVARLQAGVAHT